MGEYDSLEEYFKAHPDEEAEFLDEMASRVYDNEPVDFPEEWPLPEWLKYA